MKSSITFARWSPMFILNFPPKFNNSKVMVVVNMSMFHSKAFCFSLSIHYRLSRPHTPAQNDVVERKYRHIADIARTLLLPSHVPIRHLLEAISTTIYLINYLPTYKLWWPSLFSHLFSSIPSYSELEVFGFSCYQHLVPCLTNKLLPKTVKFDFQVTTCTIKVTNI